MTDKINVPIFLTGFPREIKAFYMKRIEGDEGFMEYVYVLMPGVSEVVGGSMRMSHSAELLEAVQACVLHTDQRKYGTLQHASFLGLREDIRL
ncbi:hypothetical protein CF319_g5974 [Tilletia indica]|nr:hypothetical protein CF319_g5974 [Tilletia indica]KAE8229943.1 hypothetical protein CF326_g5071 [Tilletia indica]